MTFHSGRALSKTVGSRRTRSNFCATDRAVRLDALSKRLNPDFHGDGLKCPKMNISGGFSGAITTHSCCFMILHTSWSFFIFRNNNTYYLVTRVHININIYRPGLSHKSFILFNWWVSCTENRNFTKINKNPYARLVKLLDTHSRKKIQIKKIETRFSYNTITPIPQSSIAPINP